MRHEYCTYPDCKEAPDAWEHKPCRNHAIESDPAKQEWCYTAICHEYRAAVCE